MKRYTPKEFLKDFKDLPMEEILSKYYDKSVVFSDSFNWQYTWSNWMSNYVNPAYHKNSRLEFLKNFGLKEEGGFNFDDMEKTYLVLKDYPLLEEDVKKFLGVMAGTGFFKETTVSHWIKSLDWQSSRRVNDKFRKSFLEIAKVKNGQNYIKSTLVLHDWWRILR
ncbi:MAG: hypothetical protein AAF960_20090 [Bacteroidota bacterium]